MVKKKTFLLVLCMVLAFTTGVFAQGKRVTVNFKNVEATAAMEQIEQQSGLRLQYSYNDLNFKVTYSAQNERAEKVVRDIVSPHGLVVKTEGQYIRISRSASLSSAGSTRKVSGYVKDEDGEPLIGVPVSIGDGLVSTVTNASGYYELQVPQQGVTLKFTYVGLGTEYVQVPQGTNGVRRDVVMRSDNQIGEVVVTGIVNKSKMSFTGSASSYTGEELRTIGVQNPIASLKALDPAFNVLDNDLYGSDPNHLPDINIRGKSSVIGVRDEVVNDPNQPLFIVDGFESSLEAVYNMDLNRIASMTILKDAASTAIYGSKAANGVVVVETVKPQAGKLRLSYNGSVAVSVPDLTSYNLMNASEKLEFERMAGRYSTTASNWTADNEILFSDIYNQRLAWVQSGVDTYWLSAPLHTGYNHKHRLYAEGGQGGFLFGVGVNYNGIEGVMKQSERDSYGGNLDIVYRVGKLQFQNQFSATNTKSADPVVDFSTYAQANPYYKKTNDDGKVERWLENSNFARAANPLYNASLNSRKENSQLLLTDYFIAEYTPVDEFKLRARFGLTHTAADGEQFVSPQDTRYDSVDATLKGSFVSTNNKQTQYDGELTAIFAKVVKQHRFTLALDGKMSELKALYQSYSVVGFPEGNYTYPSFANGYPDGGSPSYRETVTRSNSFLGTLNYAFDNRYLLDANYTLNGSSVFGSNRKYKNTWAIGLGWNIMNEKFFKDNIKGVTMLKLRASIGNPGNPSFDSSMSLTTYQFLFNSFNYFGTSTSLLTLGNKDLKWQTTLDKNVGFDLTMLNNRLTIDFNYYDKRTDPLLLNVYAVPSTGVSSYFTNLGLQKSQGVLATVSYYILRSLEKRLTWSVRGTLRHENLKLDDIDGYMDDLNAYGKARDTKRYYNGADPDAIWAVKSAGIDPSNGREQFIKKDGSHTYDFSYDDEVIVGNGRSKVEGNLGSNFTLGGFSVGLTFGYKWGGKAFNYDLYNKVENISGAALNYNQDKRAFYDRWQKPGDIAQFKNIAISANTPISSRFVQKNNSLTLQSVNVGYDFYKLAKQMKIESLRTSLYMNDVFWITTIKQERGTAYPFARSFTFALSFTL